MWSCDDGEVCGAVISVFVVRTWWVDGDAVGGIEDLVDWFWCHGAVLGLEVDRKTRVLHICTKASSS